MKRWRTEAVAHAQRGLAFALLLAWCAAWPLVGNAESRTPARDFVASKLDRVGNYVRDEVATGRIPGAVVLIQQHGKPVYTQSFGARDVATGVPMSVDTIFRLYSMSKPITSVAAMMLVDDGKLALDDPLSKFIPAFADVKVGVERTDAADKPALRLEPAQRPITIEDLLRHTSGITYGFYGDSPVHKRYAASDLFDGDVDNATFVARLAKLPLAEHPGTRWDYGHSTDVLGRVIEIVSGTSLHAFEKERLLDPLGMTETAFYLADTTQRSRVAEPLPKDRFSRPIAGLSDPVLPKRWESGGAGMIGTIGDYARFAQMLLNGGTLEGRRYLKPATVALMISDHIGPSTNIVRDAMYFPGPDSGFGLGFAVRGVAEPPFTVGEYRWDGVGGTSFFIDPGDGMFAIVMMQSPSQRGRIETELRRIIYEALER